MPLQCTGLRRQLQLTLTGVEAGLSHSLVNEDQCWVIAVVGNDSWYMDSRRPHKAMTPYIVRQLPSVVLQPSHDRRKAGDNKYPAAAEMGDRLATTDTGRKLKGCAPFRAGELDPHLTQCALGRGLRS